MLFGGDGTHCFPRKASRVYEKEKPSPYLNKFLANQIQAHPNKNQKRQKFFRLPYNCVDTPMVDTVNQTFIHILILFTFSLHQNNMIFSVSKDGIEWSLDFGPD